MADEPKILKFKRIVKTTTPKEEDRQDALFTVTVDDNSVILDVDSKISVKFVPKDAVMLALMLISASKYITSNNEDDENG